MSTSILPAIVRNTAADITNFVVGKQLLIDAEGTHPETVTITEVFGNAFYAEYQYPHEFGFTIQSVSGTPINTTATTGFTGLAPAPIQSPPQIDLDIYDGGAPIEVDPTLDYPVSVPFTTRQENDFPGVSLEGPVITKENGQQVNLNGE
jgi:hypothetical protein